MDFIYMVSLLFAGCSVVYSWDSNSGDFEKRQLVPLPRIGRSYMEAKRQGLIPSPRVGRSSSSSLYNGIENDCYLNCETYKEHEVHGGVPVSSLEPFVELRKRSSPVVEDFPNNIYGLELSKTLRSNPWDVDFSKDFFQRNTRQLIPAPRVGRSDHNYETQMQLISGMSSAEEEDMVDPIDLQLRAAFIPRLGKRGNVQSFDQFSDLEDYYKRAAAFTPRIGRAAFTPRIGKKAAFTPRIGRSTDKMATHSN